MGLQPWHVLATKSTLSLEKAICANCDDHHFAPQLTIIMLPDAVSIYGKVAATKRLFYH